MCGQAVGRSAVGRSVIVGVVCSAWLFRCVATSTPARSAARGHYALLELLPSFDDVAKEYPLPSTHTFLQLPTFYYQGNGVRTDGVYGNGETARKRNIDDSLDPPRWCSGCRLEGSQGV